MPQCMRPQLILRALVLGSQSLGSQNLTLWEIWMAQEEGYKDSDFGWIPVNWSRNISLQWIILFDVSFLSTYHLTSHLFSVKLSLVTFSSILAPGFSFTGFNQVSKLHCIMKLLYQSHQRSLRFTLNQMVICLHPITLNTVQLSLPLLTSLNTVFA